MGHPGTPPSFFRSPGKAQPSSEDSREGNKIEYLRPGVRSGLAGTLLHSPASPGPLWPHPSHGSPTSDIFCAPLLSAMDPDAHPIPTPPHLCRSHHAPAGPVSSSRCPWMALSGAHARAPQAPHCPPTLNTLTHHPECSLAHWSPDMACSGHGADLHLQPQCYWMEPQF